MRIVRFLTLLLLAATLASCVTTDPRLAAALKQTSVSQIRVETAPDVTMGGFFDRTKPDPQLPAVVRTLQSTMARELTGVPGGPVKGRLVVTLHTVDVSSKAGRVIAGNDSYIQGTVRLEDAKTGQLIAEAQSIRGDDKGVKGGGEIGIVIAMAINAAQSQGEDALAQRLSNSFTRNVKTWLTQK
ncbi:hypothetical protein CO663_10425 [Rhizobium anhuiense]|uniref:hypothetical protein n=1 Tax=Rhizobium anhuiense TaxID=1184720 RepID=UPI000BE9D776|nr:hypothetical protein [Rhizobium anhuiense]PDS59188.1 hypothetical protein CO663_10425 [Rhizobium anhuiense]